MHLEAFSFEWARNPDFIPVYQGAGDCRSGVGVFPIDSPDYQNQTCNLRPTSPADCHAPGFRLRL
jgi:hypothetical protein